MNCSMATLRLSACGLSWAASWFGSNRRCRWNQDACAPAAHHFHYIPRCQCSHLNQEPAEEAP